MIIRTVRLRNWRNFKSADVTLENITCFIGANASGKSNFLDALRFLRDVAHPKAGGLQRAVDERGGVGKIRCLVARKTSEIELEIELSKNSDSDPEWKYLLSIEQEGRGERRVLVKKETVHHLKKQILNRPDIDDQKDPTRLTQTALEDPRSNSQFRPIAEFLASITYLHIVPQLIQYAEKIGGFRVQFDPFGQGFLERIASISEKTRNSRLKKISKALKLCVPQLDELEFLRDDATGKPHLRARYEHWRPNGAFQQEDQFSDGTLRILALLWSLHESGGVLLVEEPELSLNDAIVAEIPQLLRSVKVKKQVVLTTHSQALTDHLDGSQVRMMTPSSEGTTIRGASHEEISLLNAGFSPAEVMLPKTRPVNLEFLFE